MFYIVRKNAGILLGVFIIFLCCLSIVKILFRDAWDARFLCLRNPAQCHQISKVPGTRPGKGRVRPLRPNRQKHLPVEKATTTMRRVTVTKTAINHKSTAAPLPDKAIVAGHVRYEDTSWITKELPDWQHYIYSVDDPKEKLHTLINKGHEAVPYLTFIIDHYYDLPNTTAFIHAHETSPHVENDQKSNIVSLKNLQIPYVQEQGYANLRCVEDTGCREEIKFDKKSRRTGGYYVTEILKVWKSFFGNQKLPHAIGVQCCGQFAVSRTQIRKRPVEHYQTYLRYILTTERDDVESGRILEHLWHIIFGRKPVHCPAPDECYCNVYGWCTPEDRPGGKQEDRGGNYNIDLTYDNNDMARYMDRLRQKSKLRHGAKALTRPRPVKHLTGASNPPGPILDSYAGDIDYGYGESHLTGIDYDYGNPQDDDLDYGYGDSFGMGGSAQLDDLRKRPIPDLEDPMDEGDENK